MYSFVSFLPILAVLLLGWQPVYANPSGGVVVHGQAHITEVGKTLTITQQSEKALIDWRSFNIDPTEHTEFAQPSTQSISVNRIKSDNISNIDGKLTANGNVVVINENGIIFGKNANVDVSAIVGATSDIDSSSFIDDGILKFNKPTNSDATIVNHGSITAARDKDGLVGLLAPNVINTGLIEANLGMVHLASGDTAVVDFHGDGLMNIAVSDDVKAQLVLSSGVIKASGGKIMLTSAAGKDIVESLINVRGDLKSQSVGVARGEIIIRADGANAVEGNSIIDKNVKQGSSKVLVQGNLDASGLACGEQGGRITITGDDVALIRGTVVNASGYQGKTQKAAAGGEILIGGDYLGKGVTPTAKNLYVDPEVMILNDAVHSGDGGRTILWSDNNTQFYGNIYARALGGKPVDSRTLNPLRGGLVGNGGFVETSGGCNLDAAGYVNLSASNGSSGTYLLDPANINIYGNVDPKFISTDNTVNLANSLRLWLDPSDLANTTLTYNSMGTTATGASGSNALVVADPSNLMVGARIRLGNAGVPDLAAVLGSDTYTISDISGNNVTLTTNVVNDYNSTLGNNTVYQGYVSQLNDKSVKATNLMQTNPGSMPLWISNGQNQLGMSKFSGGGTSLATPSVNLLEGSNNLSLFITTTPGGAQPTYSDIIDLSHPGGGFVIQQYANEINNYAFTYRSGGGYPNFDPAASTQLITSQPQIFSIRKDGAIITHFLNDRVNRTNTGSVQIDGANSTNPLAIGSFSTGSRNYNGTIADVILYNSALSNDLVGLVDQYQSGKWNIALTPPGTGTTEVEKATNPTDGYSNFTTSYLNHLSQSANVSLQASNDINLDLKADTLNLSGLNNSISLNAMGYIITLSGGNITTNGGDQSFTGASGIILSHPIQFNTDGGNLSLSGDVTLNANQIFNAGSGAVTFNGKVDGLNNLTANGGSLAFNQALGGITQLGDVNFTASNSTVILPSINASSINITTNSNNANVTALTGALLKSNAALGGITISSGGDVNLGNAYIDTATNNRPVNIMAAKDVVLGNINTGSADLSVGASSGNITLTSDGYSGLAAGTTSLNAGSNVLFDLNGDALTLSNGKNLLVTSGNNIGSTSLSAISTTGGGTISMVANSSGSIDLSDITLNTSTTAAVNLNTSSAELTLGSINAGTIFAKAGGVNSNLTIAAGKNLTAHGTGDAITLVTPGNFINNSGAGALSTPAGRWLIYSHSPLSNINNALAADFIRYNYGYNVMNMVAPASANGYLYDLNPILTALPDALSDINYGDNLPASLLTPYNYTLSGYINGDSSSDTITGSLNGATTYALGANVGDYDISYASGSLASNLGYNFSYVNNPTALRVLPLPLAVTADNQTKVYGDPDSALTYSHSSLIPGDAFSGALSRTAGEGVASSPYVINQGSLSAGGNYSINYVGGSLSITPKPLTLGLVGNGSKVYDGNTSALLALSNYDIMGVINSDDVSLSDYISGSYDDKNVATNKLVTVSSLGLNGTDSSNYQLSSTSVNGSVGDISTRPLSVTADNKTKVYGDPDPALTYAYTGLATGDTGSVFNGALSRAAGEGVASSPYVINKGSLSAGGNYSINYVGGSLSITPKPLTLGLVGNVSKVYDGNTSALLALSNYDIMGVINSDDVSLSDYISGSYDDKNVATNKLVTVSSLGLNGTDSSNYQLSSTSVNGSVGDISTRPLSVTANNKTKVYGDPDPALTYSHGSLIPGDAFSGALSRAAGEDVASSPYVINKGSLSAGGNYSINYVGANLSIMPANLFITAENASRLMDENNPVFTLSYQGFKYNDGPSVVTNLSIYSPASVASVAGSYDIIASNASSPNYHISYLNGTLTVMPLPVDPTPTSSIPKDIISTITSQNFASLISATLSRTPASKVEINELKSGDYSNKNKEHNGKKSFYFQNLIIDAELASKLQLW